MHNAPKYNLTYNSCSKRIGWFMRNNISYVLVLVTVPKAASWFLYLPGTRASHSYQPLTPPTLRTPKFHRFFQTLRETLKVVCTINIGRNITNIVLFWEVVVLRPPNRTFGGCFHVRDCTRRASFAYSARLIKNISCLSTKFRQQLSFRNQLLRSTYARPTHRPFLNPRPHLYRHYRGPYPAMGSVVLPHLVSGWHVDQAIMSEEERLVIIRFGRDWDPECMRQDEVLYRKRFLFPFAPHLLILHINRHRRSSQELCRHLCVRSRPGPRLQADVRWVAPLLLDCFYICCLGVFFSRVGLISLF